MSNTIYTKLLSIQQELKALAVNAKNPHFKNTYLDLEGLQEAVVPLLNAQGILLINAGKVLSSGEVVVLTTLMDTTTGETVQSEFPLPDGSAQQIAGGITYGRRYNLSSLLSITIDKDDDGNSTSSAPPRGERAERSTRRRGVS